MDEIGGLEVGACIELEEEQAGFAGRRRLQMAQELEREHTLLGLRTGFDSQVDGLGAKVRSGPRGELVIEAGGRKTVVHVRRTKGRGVHRTLQPREHLKLLTAHIRVQVQRVAQSKVQQQSDDQEAGGEEAKRAEDASFADVLGGIRHAWRGLAGWFGLGRL